MGSPGDPSAGQRTPLHTLEHSFWLQRGEQGRGSRAWLCPAGGDGDLNMERVGWHRPPLPDLQPPSPERPLRAPAGPLPRLVWACLGSSSLCMQVVLFSSEPMSPWRAGVTSGHCNPQGLDKSQFSEKSVRGGRDCLLLTLWVCVCGGGAEFAPRFWEPSPHFLEAKGRSGGPLSLVVAAVKGTHSISEVGEALTRGCTWDKSRLSWPHPHVLPTQ